MQVLRVDSETKALYKILITFILIIIKKKITFFLSTTINFLCVLIEHHCSHFHTAPVEFNEEI